MHNAHCKKKNISEIDRTKRKRQETKSIAAHEIVMNCCQNRIPSLYNYNDAALLQASLTRGTPQLGLSSIDELLERDRLREKDGFPRKIRIGRLIRPGKGQKNAIVVIPTTVEEKFIHDNHPHAAGESASGGAGEGDEGEVIGEEPVRPQGGEGTGAGEGQEGPHEITSNAYDLGKILTEKFQLPNLKDKGSKRSLTKYTYDVTDTHRGFGQFLDKKATLRRVLQTNFALDRIGRQSAIDPAELIVSPADKMYRVLSREKDFESQALVFFVRDYSGSMEGRCTELVVAQHVLIYSWLLYQYAKRVETRFVLHDTDAREVADFYTYFNSKVAGGTQVASAYRLVNEIIEKESLVRDYNLYVFHGTDGDDWDGAGEQAIPALRKMLPAVNRIGITVIEHSYAQSQKTDVHRYIEQSGLLTQFPELLAMDVFDENADENRLIDGIRKLIAHPAASRSG